MDSNLSAWNQGPCCCRLEDTDESDEDLMVVCDEEERVSVRRKYANQIT